MCTRMYGRSFYSLSEPSLQRGAYSAVLNVGIHMEGINLCNCGEHNALNKSMLIFKCPCNVVWFGNLPPPFILPPLFRILNGGGRILNGGARLNSGARFPNQTNTTYLNKKNKYLNKKNEY
jgi:hypothetical protein